MLLYASKQYSTDHTQPFCTPTSAASHTQDKAPQLLGIFLIKREKDQLRVIHCRQSHNLFVGFVYV